MAELFPFNFRGDINDFTGRYVRINNDTVNQPSVGITPFIRENPIDFAARNLKPGASPNYFFDEIQVNNFVQRSAVINVSTRTALANLKINQALYGKSSYAYAEVLGTTISGTANSIYVDDNFLSLHLTKTDLNNITSTEFKVDDLVYQTSTNSAFVSSFTTLSQPNYTFLGKVKKWTPLSTSEGVLVVDPVLGTVNSTFSSANTDNIFNLTGLLPYARRVAYLHANNRFSTGEELLDAKSNSSIGLTVSATNPYVALSSVVPAVNTSNLKTIVISSNDHVRDLLTTIVGNTISVVAGTNLGFSANVIAVSNLQYSGASHYRELVLDATLPQLCTSNSIYSIGKHIIDDVGSVYGKFHIPSQSGLKWLSGERVFTITDTSTYNGTGYSYRSTGKYTALGKTNSAENARNNVLKDQTPDTLQAPQSNIDPTLKSNDRKFMTQTFVVPRANTADATSDYGIFLTSVDLCFYSKPTNNNELLPVTVAICKIKNGLPSNEIIASKTLEPYYVNIASGTSIIPSFSDPTTYTKFTFTDPVYLLPSTEYGISVISESGDYKVWAAAIGDTVNVNGNVRRVSESPYVRNFFLPQNASSWNPIPGYDLMFRINRASFESSNTVNFNLLTKSTYGMQTNTAMDMVKVSVTEQQFAPTKISYSIQSQLTDGSSAGSVSINNNELYSFGKDTTISSISNKKRRLITAGNVNSTTVTATLFTDDNRVTPVINKERMGLFALQNIINNAGIANNLITVTNGGAHSNAANIAVTFSAPDVGSNRATGNVTPALLVSGKVLGINMTSAGSGYLTSPTITIAEAGASSNATAIVNGETDASGGNIFTKYQTKVVQLQDGFDAGDLVVRLDAIKPAGTNVAVYFKVLSGVDSDAFVTKKWQKMVPVSDNVSPDQSTKVSMEYHYSLTKPNVQYFDGQKMQPVGGLFKYFAVKIRLTAEDPTVVPIVNSLKVIATPAG